MRRPSAAVTDLLSRAVVAMLFTLLVINILGDFLRTGRITGLLLLVGESLVVVLTVIRRRARVVDRSAIAATLTAASVVGPVLLRAGQLTPLAPDALTAALSALGLAVVVVGKLSLGRSFGLVPANRGVVVRGPYALVRHPIYTGYLATHIAFVLQHPAPWNICVLIVADVALVLRALLEERVLSLDAEYQGYCQRVGWHLLPGIF